MAQRHPSDIVAAPSWVRHRCLITGEEADQVSLALAHRPEAEASGIHRLRPSAIAHSRQHLRRSSALPKEPTCSFSSAAGRGCSVDLTRSRFGWHAAEGADAWGPAVDTPPCDGRGWTPQSGSRWYRLSLPRSPCPRRSDAFSEPRLSAFLYVKRRVYAAHPDAAHGIAGRCV